MPFTVAQIVGVAQQLDTSHQRQIIEQLKKSVQQQPLDDFSQYTKLSRLKYRPDVVVGNSDDLEIKLGAFMKKLLLVLPMLSLLSACVITDPTGKPVPIVIQTPSPQAVIIDGRIKENAPIYVCQIKPFIDTFKAENTSRGKAILDTQKQCLAKNDAMFCEVKDIECTEYK